MQLTLKGLLLCPVLASCSNILQQLHNLRLCLLVVKAGPKDLKLKHSNKDSPLAGSAAS